MSMESKTSSKYEESKIRSGGKQPILNQFKKMSLSDSKQSILVQKLNVF